MGAEAIHFSASCPPVSNRKVRQTSRSTEKVLAHFYHEDLVETLENMKEDGYTLLGVELAEGSRSLHDIDVSPYGKIALVVGAERNGVEEETLALCDGIIHIPMYGKNSSMNVIHALAISLYEVVRQKQKGSGIIHAESL
ncbi:MAG: TrmH family RNA methyltransferase, partial [Saprospiraceae bacterium]